jgi:hypothetical protein
MTSRLRQAFKRQDSYSATQEVPSLARAHNEEVEMDALGQNVDEKSVVETPGREEEKEVDPAALDVKDLKPSDLLSNGKERPIEVRTPSSLPPL